MTTKTRTRSAATGSMALSLLLALFAGGRPAFAGPSNGPLEGKDAGPARVPGLPNLAIQGEADPRALSLDDAAISPDRAPDVQIPPAEAGISEVARSGDLPPTVAADPPANDSPAGTTRSPAAAEEDDLGELSSARRGRGSSEGHERAVEDPGGVVATANAVFAAVVEKQPVKAIASGLAETGVLRRLYEAAEEKSGPDSAPGAVPPGPAGRAGSGALSSPAENYLGSLGFDALREEFPFIPDAWALSARDLVRTVGPVAAANMAGEIAARKAPARREAAASASAAWAEYRAALERAKGAANAPSVKKEDARMAVWRALWLDGGFRATARHVLDEGRFTPLEHRRLLLGLDINKGFARQRLNELAMAFAEAYHEDAGLTWIGRQRAVAAMSGLRKEDPRLRDARQEAARFDELPETVKTFGPYVEESLDLILLSAPDDADISGRAEEVLRKVARILRPALRRHAEGGAARNLVSFDQEDARQLFFETLLKALFPDYRLEIRVGLGSSNDPPSIRMLSYAIPALNQLRAFARNGTRPPDLVIFNAHRLSQTVNNLDPEASLGNAELTNKSLSAFVRSFYPDVAGHVRVEMRLPDEIRRHPLAENVGHLRALLAAEPAAADPRARQLLNDLAKMTKQAIRHGGEDAATERALVYAAAHAGPGIFGNIQLAEDLDGAGSLPPHGVIEFGGDGERSFDRLQAYLAGRHPTSSANSRTYLTNTAFGAARADGRGLSPARARPILALMEVGGTPPYYHPNGGEFPEITLDDPRAQLTALGIGTTEELLEYYRRHFSRPFQNNGRPDVDRSIPFDVEVLSHALGGPALIRFLMEFEPGR